MTHSLHIIQVISGLVTIALVLLQRTSGDMGSAFGEQSSFLKTRRGAERFFFVATIVAGAVFVLSNLASLAFVG